VRHHLEVHLDGALAQAERPPDHPVGVTGRDQPVLA
jgi:hypothetical protein